MDIDIEGQLSDLASKKARKLSRQFTGEKLKVVKSLHGKVQSH